MLKNILTNKPTRMFIILCSFFIVNALTAEFIGVKIFSLEETFGWQPTNLFLFGGFYSFNLTCGVLLWPIVFVMTDIINEYYGEKGVKFISWLSVIVIVYAFVMLFGAMQTAPNSWWITSKKSAGVENMEIAFNAVFGQGLGIIIASMIAFLVGQFVDVFIFHRIKKKTGEKSIWLRATGSTLVSQLVDSFIVLVFAFYLFPKIIPNQGAAWPINQIISIGVMNYCYKFIIAILLTPFLYWVHKKVENYLGSAMAMEMKKAAMNE